MRTAIAEVYLCDHCNRRRFTRRAMEKHERWCQCQGCVHLTPAVLAEYASNLGLVNGGDPPVCAAGHWDATGDYDDFDMRNVPTWKRSQPLPCPDRSVTEGWSDA